LNSALLQCVGGGRRKSLDRHGKGARVYSKGSVIKEFRAELVELCLNHGGIVAGEGCDELGRLSCGDIR
jgi:hypothetical protein